MATKSSLEKWPTQFNVVKISESFVGNELTFFLVSGTVNKNQYKHVDDAINILATQEIAKDSLVISTLLNQKQLENFNAIFEPRSRTWRGQYYSLANAIVDACKEALNS